MHILILVLSALFLLHSLNALKGVVIVLSVVLLWGVIASFFIAAGLTSEEATVGSALVVTGIGVVMWLYYFTPSKIDVTSLINSKGLIDKEYSVVVDDFVEAIGNWGGSYFNNYSSVLTHASNNQINLKYTGKFQSYHVKFNKYRDRVTVKVIDLGDNEGKHLGHLSVNGWLTYHPRVDTYPSTLQYVKVQEALKDINNLESSLNYYFNNLLNNQSKP